MAFLLWTARWHCRELCTPPRLRLGTSWLKGEREGAAARKGLKTCPFPRVQSLYHRSLAKLDLLSAVPTSVCVCSPQENRFGRLLLIATCCADLVYTSPQSKWTVNVIVFVRTVRLTSCDACLELGQIFLLWLYGNGSLLHSSTDTTHPFLFILTASPCRCRCKSWRLFLGALVRAGIDWHCIIHPTNSSEW